ncbi:Uncharacterised protein [Klebsiella pneumoniae]|nr:Uncharacterised protein [Klebsiella pneumoniae]
MAFLLIKNTIGTGECLYQSVVTQVFINVKRIESRAVKSREEHIDHQQDINPFFFGSLCNVLVIIVKALRIIS